MSLNDYFDEYVLFGSRKYVVDEDLYRVDHDETLWRENLPEVFPFEPSHYTVFSKHYQLLEKSLNETMSKTRWRNMHLGGNAGNDATALNNRQGFEMSGDPRADWVNLRNLTSPPPKQEALVFGGAIMKKKAIVGEYFYPEYIDGNQPAPTLEWLKKRPWLYFDCLSVDGTANGIVLRRFPQGNGARVYSLLLASKPIRIHLSKVTKLNRRLDIPSPYTYRYT